MFKSIIEQESTEENFQKKRVTKLKFLSFCALSILALALEASAIIDGEEKISDNFSSTPYVSLASKKKVKTLIEDKNVLKNTAFISQKNVHVISGKLTAILNKDLTIEDVTNISQNCNNNIVLGTGLSCEAGRSLGTPFDVLGFIASAEKIRSVLGYGSIIHFIADDHACSKGFGEKGFASNEELNNEAIRQKNLYTNLARKLGIQATYKVMLASEFHNSQEFQNIMEIVKSKLPESKEQGITSYTQLEVADIEYLRKYKNVAIKISWIMHEGDKDAKRDETSYDIFNKKVFPENEGNDISFIYTKSGVNLELKPHIALNKFSIDCVPYSYHEGHQRILLATNEDAGKKLSEFQEGLKNHARTRNKNREVVYSAVIDKFNSIVSTFSDVFGGGEGNTVDEKIDSILTKIFPERKNNK